ncbi:hypothetical protein ACLOJK_024200, partial [Asimina triloba]
RPRVSQKKSRHRWRGTGLRRERRLAGGKKREEESPSGEDEVTWLDLAGSGWIWLGEEESSSLEGAGLRRERRLAEGKKREEESPSGEDEVTWLGAGKMKSRTIEGFTVAGGFRRRWDWERRVGGTAGAMVENGGSPFGRDDERWLGLGEN